jgi:hypothetical protein
MKSPIRIQIDGPYRARRLRRALRAIQRPTTLALTALGGFVAMVVLGAISALLGGPDKS